MLEEREKLGYHVPTIKVPSTDSGVTGCRTDGLNVRKKPTDQRAVSTSGYSTIASACWFSEPSGILMPRILTEYVDDV